MFENMYGATEKRSGSGLITAVLLLSIALLAGCSTVTTQSFHVPAGGSADASAISNDADFSKYSKLMSGDMGIFMPEESPLPEEDLERIRQIFRTAFRGQLSEYTIVESAGPDVLMAQASLVDLRNSANIDLPELRIGVRQMAKPGSLLFLMELRDSETDRVLGRAADNSNKSDPDATPSFATANTGPTDWTSVEEAAEHWAVLFRQFLDANLKK